jgi:uncharacterized protein YebE (UPF0316 family)
MELLLGALLIYCLRIVDVSIGTLRTLYMVRGDRLRAVPLAFCESLVWVIAISKIMAKVNENRWLLLAYAAGFATGTFTGITIERWIASGWILARIVGVAQEHSLAKAIRDAGFGVTALKADGREREQCILFVVAPRKRGEELLSLIRSVDADAFVTIDSVQTAMGGYLPQMPTAAGVRK